MQPEFHNAKRSTITLLLSFFLSFSEFVHVPKNQTFPGYLRSRLIQVALPTWGILQILSVKEFQLACPGEIYSLSFKVPC